MEADAIARGYKGFIVGFAVGLVSLGALEDFEGPEDCANRSSKWTIGFLETHRSSFRRFCHNN